MVFDSSGQVSKSAVEKPVVVIMDATWKDALVMASNVPAQVLRIFAKIIATDVNTIIKQVANI